MTDRKDERNVLFSMDTGKIFHCSHAGTEEVGTVNHKTRNVMSMLKSRQCRQQHIKNTDLKLLAKQRTIRNAPARVQDRSTSTIVILENEKGGSCTSSSGNWTTGWGEGERSSGVLVDDRAVGGCGGSSGGGSGGGSGSSTSSSSILHV